MVRYITENKAEYLSYQQQQRPKGYLVLIVNDRASQSIPLHKVIKLGRDRKNTVVISDQKVSRNHAAITIQDDNAIVIDDYSSSNGTYVNNLLVKQATHLQDKDRIQIGDTQFIFTLTELEMNQLIGTNSTATVSPSVPATPIPVPPTPPTTNNQTLAENPHVIWVTLGCIVVITIILLITLAFLLGVYLSSV